MKMKLEMHAETLDDESKIEAALRVEDLLLALKFIRTELAKRTIDLSGMSGLDYACRMQNSCTQILSNLGLTQFFE